MVFFFLLFIVFGENLIIVLIKHEENWNNYGPMISFRFSFLVVTYRDEIITENSKYSGSFVIVVKAGAFRLTRKINSVFGCFPPANSLVL